MTRTWILVADAAQGRLFETSTGAPDWEVIGEFENPEGRIRSREFHHRPSGGLETQEGAYERGAMEPLSIKKVEERRFAKALSEMFSKRLEEYDRLILVAPPEFLGILRRELSPTVQRRIFDTIAKDYASAGARELSDRIEIAQLE